jgi:hypothetical protein
MRYAAKAALSVLGRSRRRIIVESMFTLLGMSFSLAASPARDLVSLAR